MSQDTYTYCPYCFSIHLVGWIPQSWTALRLEESDYRQECLDCHYTTLELKEVK